MIKRREPTVMVRVKRNLLTSMRLEFPNMSTDNSRIESLFENHKKFQGAINGLGGFLYGKTNWQKIGKKR